MVQSIKPIQTLLVLALFVAPGLSAREYHVATVGSNSNLGSKDQPLRTISRAAQLAQPGDEIVVHAGIYRERITPPRGGTSDRQRIIYRAAVGEEVHIRGSEPVKNWKKHRGTVWKVSLPDAFFGDYNPFRDTIWGDWFNNHGRIHHTGEVYMNDKSFFESAGLEGVLEPKHLDRAVDKDASLYTWYCESDEVQTTIYANFHEADPNKEQVEITVRPTCFYPERTGMNYITIRGFHLSRAATQWAAPTAEQIGLIGTHWSKGWIIEDNVISHSRCVGISLGKERSTGHNVWFRNQRKDGATHYNEVILRALDIGWSKSNIGSHIVRNNTISECEQAGIVGSLGAVFSQISNNHIYNIWAKRQFSGSEMAGIKIHGSIDMLIKNNCIHHAGRGLWLDWMAQGTRVTGNLFYKNSTDDIFMEVNHGPYMVDNNILLSPVSIRDWSGGGAFTHNLVNGVISMHKMKIDRATPYHLPHSTKLAGIRSPGSGDNRYYNNVFVKGYKMDEIRAGNWSRHSFGPRVYKESEFEIFTGGNVYYQGAEPCPGEKGHAAAPAFNPGITLENQEGAIYLLFSLDETFTDVEALLVNSELLGETIISACPWENPDGSALLIDRDYFGTRRDVGKAVPGPFNQVRTGENRIQVW